MVGNSQKETPHCKGEVSSLYFGEKESDLEHDDEDDDVEMDEEDSVQELETEI